MIRLIDGFETIDLIPLFVMICLVIVVLVILFACPYAFVKVLSALALPFMFWIIFDCFFCIKVS